MEDKQGKALSQYEFTVKSRYRTRGAFVLETNQGLKLLREHRHIGSHFLFENKIKSQLLNAGMPHLDLVVKTRENEDYVKLDSGEVYVVTNWFYGEECNLKNCESVYLAAKNLGKIHQILKDIEPPVDMETCDCENEKIIRHNREMKRVYAYMRSKKRKNEFEIFALNCFPTFYEQGCEAEKLLFGLNEEPPKLCHGDYNYHNVIFTDQGIATTNFEKACLGTQLNDLYYFLRKAMEKNEWNIEIGDAILNGYDSEKTINKASWDFLYVMLLFPEKYWKLLNQYYNRKKSWLSQRNIEKLLEVKEQSEARMQFVQSVMNR